MKQKKTTETVKENKLKVGQTFMRTSTMEDCNKAFIIAATSDEKRREGDDRKSLVPDFVALMRRVIELGGRGSFAFSDVVREAKYLNLDVNTQLRPLFNRYVETFVALHKLEPIESLDEQVYLILN